MPILLNFALKITGRPSPFRGHKKVTGTIYAIGSKLWVRGRDSGTVKRKPALTLPHVESVKFRTEFMENYEHVRLSLGAIS